MARLFEGTAYDRPSHCDRCGELEADCKCPAPVPAVTPTKDQTARLAVEKRAKGKWMTIVRGLTAADNDLAALLSELKSICAAGGAREGDDLLLQGEQLERVRAHLKSKGYKVRG